MGELRISAWKRYGKDRLYVSQPDGTTVAWFDRVTGRITIEVEELRDAAMEALAPYLTRQPPPSASGAASASAQTCVSPPPPDYDLALNKPGAALLPKLREATPGLLQRSLAWVLRRRTTAYSWKVGIAGERVVGRELKRLSRHGWLALHSIPLSARNDIDHLLIGPGGVFTINTKNHPKASVWVGDDMVKLNGGESYPYVRKSRSEAVRAKRVLDRGCGFPVPVSPLIVFVKPESIRVERTLLDVRALAERDLTSFGPRSGVLSPAQLMIVYSVARDRRNWIRE
ncbi:nuclease-related domain-containing protein [Streptomyces sp. CAU 1734]|uniref:nuclease-related domain-containing protein n=1 Tax=Streptomyces sp. CAU 1734 TaxID=3140360 RepID=UPI003260FB83